MEKKTFRDIEVGDYMYVNIGTGEDVFSRAFKVTEILEEDDCVKYCGIAFGNTFTTPMFFAKINKKNLDENNEITKCKEPIGLHLVSTWKDIPNTGDGGYIHLKTGNEYTLVDDNFKFKDYSFVEHVLDGYDSTLLSINKNKLEWKRGLVLYKCEYDNPDGKWYARYRDDFYKNFKRVV